jgi:hypothetical protein
VVKDPAPRDLDLIDKRREVSQRKDDINLDYYQHPDKRYDRGIRYSRAHDIYSLGCVLLEIGLWKPLHELVDIDEDDYDKTKREFQALSANLNGHVPPQTLNLMHIY